MPPQKSEQFKATRRFERAFRREKLRKGLIVAGISMVTVGFLLRVRPLGLSLSNPAAIPKSDPHAGLLIAQSLPSTIGPTIGLCLILLGSISLLIYWLISRTPPDA